MCVCHNGYSGVHCGHGNVKQLSPIFACSTADLLLLKVLGEPFVTKLLKRTFLNSHVNNQSLID